MARGKVWNFSTDAGKKLHYFDVVLDPGTGMVGFENVSREGRYFADDLAKTGIAVIWPGQEETEHLDLEDGVRFMLGLDYEMNRSYANGFDWVEGRPDTSVA